MSSLLSGKAALVTGASSGIGLVTALELAKMGARVAMACRPGAKAEAAYHMVAAEVGRELIELIGVDLASMPSVRAFASEFRKTHQQLDILVNNAGVYLSHRQTTADGLERTFAVNHLAHFLLTDLLLDMLKATASSRIVNVASRAERWGTIDFADLQCSKRYSGMRAYSQSKLANVLFTYELARRLTGSGVTANSLHPGIVRTAWGRDISGPMKIVMALFARFMISPEAGAQTSIYLASSPDVEGSSGGYYVKCKPVRSSRASYNEAVARRLWSESEKLTSTY